MKKVFTLAAVAVTMVMGLASCQNDSPSSFNAAPQTNASTEKAESNKANYYYQASIPNDIFALFDVNIVRTIGSDVKTYTFTKSDTYENAMATGTDKFEADKNVDVTVKATFTPKANHQEVIEKIIAEKGADATIDLSIVPIYTFPIKGLDKARIYGIPGRHSVKAQVLTVEENFNKIKEQLEYAFSVDNQPASK